MKAWRKRFPRLTLPNRRTSFWLAGLFLILLVLSGCGGGAARHESWPGMTLVEDTLYVANLETVQAIDTATGKVYWDYPSQPERNVGPFYAHPTLAEEFGLLLVAGFNDQTVYALNLGETAAERPDLAWEFLGAGGQYVGGGAVAGNLFLIGNGDGNVYAIKLSDGSLAWTHPTDDRVWATPLVVEDTVYVASLDHHLYALDAATGEQKWVFETPGAITATPVYHEGYLWVGGIAGNLYKVDAATGTEEWKHSTPHGIWATPVVNDSHLYFVDVSGDVYALDTETHEFLWTNDNILEDVANARPALSPDGSRLFVAGYEKGYIYALNTDDGSSIPSWNNMQDELETPGRLPGDLLADEERLYTLPVLIDARVRAFDLETGSVLWTTEPD